MSFDKRSEKGHFAQFIFEFFTAEKDFLLRHVGYENYCSPKFMQALRNISDPNYKKLADYIRYAADYCLLWPGNEILIYGETKATERIEINSWQWCFKNSITYIFIINKNGIFYQNVKYIKYKDTAYYDTQNNGKKPLPVTYKYKIPWFNPNLIPEKDDLAKYLNHYSNNMFAVMDITSFTNLIPDNELLDYKTEYNQLKIAFDISNRMQKTRERYIITDNNHNIVLATILAANDDLYININQYPNCKIYALPATTPFPTIGQIWLNKPKGTKLVK